LPVLVGGDGLRHAGVHREGVTEPGHPDDLQDRAGDGPQGERPAAGARSWPTRRRAANWI
jgi:hypothetical protein